MPFKPAFEVLEEYPGFYAMLFCEGDGGFGIEVIVPKSTDIDARLLGQCAQFVTLAPPLTPLPQTHPHHSRLWAVFVFWSPK